VALILLGENEEKLLDMPFEQILGQISHMPIRFVLEESQNIEESLSKFDKQMSIKIPTILLERLSKEFEESSSLMS